MVQYFIDGGAFMWPILFALLFGLAFAFERAYSLVLSSIDSSKLFEDVSSAMQGGKFSKLLTSAVKHEVQLLEYFMLLCHDTIEV